MNRTILHCDLNCFFASAEMLYHPEFRNVPMAIAGDIKQRHGIILAKNVPAKTRGVKTAETIGEALKKCPELILRSPDYETYDYLSGKVRELYYEYTDRIEPFGIDECWLDISESIPYFGSWQYIVSSLLRRVKEEIGLTLSIGISNNKVYAKLGSDIAKEDEFFRIDSLDDIGHLPVSSLLGVGEKSIDRLHSFGIHTIRDAADSSPSYLESVLGKYGISLYLYANGLDNSPVARIDQPHEPVKSISNSMTCSKDVCGLDDFKIVLTVLSENVGRRLLNKGLYYKTVHLILRDTHLKVRTLQKKLKENTDLAKQIYDEALSLFLENCDIHLPYRSIGVAVSGLSDKKEESQIDLFEKSGTYSLKQKKKETAIEQIRRRFGKQAVCSLRVLEDSELSSFVNKNMIFKEDEKQI